MGKSLAGRTPSPRISDVPFASVAMGSPAPAGERRDLIRREALSRRVLAEFTEMPGLALTLQQAARLFGIGTEACARILTQHIEQGQLRLRADSHYTLAADPTHR